MKRRATLKLALALALLTFGAATHAASLQENFDGVTAPALPTGWTGSFMLNTWSRPAWN